MSADRTEQRIFDAKLRAVVDHAYCAARPELREAVDKAGGFDMVTTATGHLELSISGELAASIELAWLCDSAQTVDDLTIERLPGPDEVPDDISALDCD